MLIGQLAFAAAAIFAGAAFYINAVEQPARMKLATEALLTEWKPSYKGGAAMQGPLAIAGFLLGSTSWLATGDLLWLAGALLMIANWPFTYFAIMPTNRQLMATDPDGAGAETRAMIERWNRLHAVRTLLGLLASCAFGVASASA